LALARATIRAYLGRGQQAFAWPFEIAGKDSQMVQPLSAPESLTQEMVRPSRTASAIVASAAVLAAFLMVGAAGLWVHYGTAVFFEMIKTGIAACI